MATKRKTTAPLKIGSPEETEIVNFTVAMQQFPRRSIREEELNVVTEERDSFRRAADALLEERKKWQDHLLRASDQIIELKCANALLRRAVEETKTPQLRLNAVLACPAIDVIFEQLKENGRFVLTETSSVEERELISALVQLGKVHFDGDAVLTEEGRQLLREWA